MTVAIAALNRVSVAISTDTFSYTRNNVFYSGGKAYPLSSQNVPVVAVVTGNTYICGFPLVYFIRKYAANNRVFGTLEEYVADFEEYLKTEIPRVCSTNLQITRNLSFYLHYYKDFLSMKLASGQFISWSDIYKQEKKSWDKQRSLPGIPREPVVNDYINNQVTDYLKQLGLETDKQKREGRVLFKQVLSKEPHEDFYQYLCRFSLLPKVFILGFGDKEIYPSVYRLIIYSVYFSQMWNKRESLFKGTAESSAKVLVLSPEYSNILSSFIFGFSESMEYKVYELFEEVINRLSVKISNSKEREALKDKLTRYVYDSLMTYKNDYKNDLEGRLNTLLPLQLANFTKALAFLIFQDPREGLGQRVVFHDHFIETILLSHSYGISVIQ